MPCGTEKTISAFMAQIPGVSDRMTLSPSLSLFLSFSPSFFFFLLLFSSYLSFSLIDVIMIMKMSALGGECERARGERKIRGEGGGGQPGIVLSFLPVSVPRCCVARRLGAGTTLHAAAPPGKVVFARPHRDSCSWGAALRACSWGASRDGHVRGVASRRRRQS